MLVKQDPGIVYESPDGGHTVYARKKGEIERVKIYESDAKKDTIKRLEEDKLWGEIRRAAEHNPALQKALEQCIILYRLSKNG